MQRTFKLTQCRSELRLPKLPQELSSEKQYLNTERTTAADKNPRAKSSLRSSTRFNEADDFSKTIVNSKDKEVQKIKKSFNEFKFKRQKKEKEVQSLEEQFKTQKLEKHQKLESMEKLEHLKKEIRKFERLNKNEKNYFLSLKHMQTTKETDLVKSKSYLKHLETELEKLQKNHSEVKNSISNKKKALKKTETLKQNTQTLINQEKAAKQKELKLKKEEFLKKTNLHKLLTEEKKNAQKKSLLRENQKLLKKLKAINQKQADQEELNNEINECENHVEQQDLLLYSIKEKTNLGSLEEISTYYKSLVQQNQNLKNQVKYLETQLKKASEELTQLNTTYKEHSFVTENQKKSFVLDNCENDSLVEKVTKQNEALGVWFECISRVYLQLHGYFKDNSFLSLPSALEEIHCKLNWLNKET